MKYKFDSQSCSYLIKIKINIPYVYDITIGILIMADGSRYTKMNRTS
jgi:hypothetical protein